MAQHLRAWIAYSGTEHELFYWRTRAGVEVDFIVYGRGGFWAVEVRSTATVRTHHLRGLKTFRDDYPECRPLFLYRGMERLLIDGIPCVPVSDFLQRVIPKERSD